MSVIGTFWSVTAIAAAEPLKVRAAAMTATKQEAHLNWAMAYLEIGLGRDALEEAVVVMAGHPKPELMKKAVALVFGKRPALPGLADRLSKVLLKD
jgi:hypothetical protein